ncbi:MAG: sigma-70 family RNA polymerase sigma factor [bacterium]|nr:sigma-70 family RNA polymerase sigma factor [bacterium]
MDTMVLPQSDSPNDWIIAIAFAKDQSAFAALFNHFAPRLKTYLLRRGMAEGVAEELVQEAMLRVWTKAEQFDPARASAAAWIYSIARNLLVDTLRREHGSGGEHQVEELHADCGTPEDELGAAQSDKRLRSALGRLPTDQAELLRLSFFEERSHAQIAHRLVIPLGTVKSRLRRATAQLRLALGPIH